MADLPKYHINEQTAYALLRPVHASIRELEARTRHYINRLHLQSEQDRAALEAANRALAEASREIERLVTKA
jgi:hypothetical protein